MNSQSTSEKLCPHTHNPYGCGEHVYEGCNGSMRKAIEMGHYMCLKSGLDRGKNPNKVYKSIWNDVPLTYVVGSSNANVTVNVTVQMLHLLIERGANVNGVGYDSNSLPLYGANYECSKILLKEGATIDIVEDNEGWTPLFKAVNSDHLDVVELLLDNGANFNHVDKNGDGIFDIWSSNETKLFLKKYKEDMETLEIKEPQKN